MYTYTVNLVRAHALPEHKLYTYIRTMCMVRIFPGSTPYAHVYGILKRKTYFCCFHNVDMRALPLCSVYGGTFPEKLQCLFTPRIIPSEYYSP